MIRLSISHKFIQYVYFVFLLSLEMDRVCFVLGCSYEDSVCFIWGWGSMGDCWIICQYQYRIANTITQLQHSMSSQSNQTLTIAIQSSSPPIQCFLMRHAESQFNQRMNSCQFDSLSSQAKKLYQFDPLLIDCTITKKGQNEVNAVQFPSSSEQGAFSFDTVFVSPLTRAIETVRLLIQARKIRCAKIVVVPCLTEVVSKVCDFGDDIECKIKKYGNSFDFSLLKNNQQFWQDSLIDPQIRAQLPNPHQKSRSYLKILQQIFPSALESVDRCLKRSQQVIEQIKQLSRKEKSKKILIVSHNRILKNILTKGENLQNFKILANCQIRQITL